MSESTAGPDLVLFERRGPVAVLTINRPERRNSFDRDTAYAMEAAIDRFEAEDELRVAVITGAGGVFCAGQDLIAAAKGEIGTTQRRGGGGLMKSPPAKPLIAAVEGYAVGGGLEICLACDLLVASRTAKMGMPEVKHGALAMGGGLFRLPRRVPYALSMELALTGASWSAERFHDWGLVNRLAEPETALEVALELAQEVAAAGPVAVTASKAIIRESNAWSETESWDQQDAHVTRVLQSQDYREGVAAFGEKRAPVWKGR